jgi:hypothetical protein
MEAQKFVLYSILDRQIYIYKSEYVYVCVCVCVCLYVQD